MSVIRQSAIGAAIILTSVFAVIAGMWSALSAMRLARPGAQGLEPVLAFWGAGVAIVWFPLAYWPAVTWAIDHFRRLSARLLVSLAVAPLIALMPTVTLIAIFTLGSISRAPASQWLLVYGFYVGFSLVCMPGWTAALSCRPKR